MTDTDVVAEYRRRTPGSEKLAKRAGSVFPSGITHDARHLQPYGIYVDRAQGSRKWDVDGNEYVDYFGGHGSLLLGHNHPDVVKAVTEQLTRGTHFGAGHELEIRWAELVQKLIPSAERVRFTNSGTEATLLAFRLARAFTGKRRIIRFLDHFHGWHDHVAFGVKSHHDGTPTPGVLPPLADDILLCTPGDIASLRELLASHDDIAAAIVEPTGASWGRVPLNPEFLHELRTLTTQHGVVLIFDEVVSGFRCSPGGAQAVFKIKPDLTALAKVLAGGFPGGAIVGRAEILDWLDFQRSADMQREKVTHQGTYNGNPVSAAAGIAALEVVAQAGVCDKANAFTAELRNRLDEMLRQEGSNWSVYGSFSGFHLFLNAENEPITRDDIEAFRVDLHTLKRGNPAALANQLRLILLNHGVDIAGWPGGLTSSAHNADDLDRTVNAFRTAVRTMTA